MSTLIILLGIAIYLVPAIVAQARLGRHHRYTNAIGVLNLFLGWTFVGWVVSLVWAIATDNTITNQQKAQ